MKRAKGKYGKTKPHIQRTIMRTDKWLCFCDIKTYYGIGSTPSLAFYQYDFENNIKFK